jgi:predicted metal-dependent enzyme (double-stranded beta helix superfamily)
MFAVPPNTIALSSTPASAHPALIARQFADSPERWRSLLGFHTSERFATLVERTETQEIWLMSWLPGQGAGLHNHGGATGAFRVITGTLTERVARRSGHERPAGTAHRVNAGQSRVFGPGYVHQICNGGLEPAVSIHVYRPARLPMINYWLGPGSELRRAVPS